MHEAQHLGAENLCDLELSSPGSFIKWLKRCKEPMIASTLEATKLRSSGGLSLGGSSEALSRPHGLRPRSGRGSEYGLGPCGRLQRKPTFKVASSRTFTSSMSFFNSSALSREITDWPD